MKFFAHHGVLLQEHAVGACFYLTLRLDTDLSAAAKSDDIKDTISYADVYDVVNEQMACSSALLEHVAGRIAESLFATFPTVSHIHIELFKENPPMGADVGSVGIVMDFSASER